MRAAFPALPHSDADLPPPSEPGHCRWLSSHNPAGATVHGAAARLPPEHTTTWPRRRPGRVAFPRPAARSRLGLLHSRGHCEMHGASTRGVDPRSSRSFLSVVVLTRRRGPRHHASTQFALAKPVRPLPTLCPCASIYGRDRAAPRSRPLSLARSPLVPFFCSSATRAGARSPA